MALYAGSGIGAKNTASRLKALTTPKKAATYKPVSTYAGGGSSGTGSTATNAKKAAAKTTAVKKPTVTTPTADTQTLPTYRDYLADYMKAYEPTLNRESQRAASEMASRGLTNSTAGMDYVQNVRNTLAAEANKQALAVAEQARQAELQAAVELYGMNLGYEQGMALGFEDKGFTFNPTTNRWVTNRLTANTPLNIANAAIGATNMGDATEDAITASAPRSTVFSAATGERNIADVRGARLLREYQLQKQVADQNAAIEMQRLALEREALAEEKRQNEWSRLNPAGSDPLADDPYQQAIDYYTATKDTRTAEAVYTRLKGTNVVDDAKSGDPKALRLLALIRPVLYAQLLGKTPTEAAVEQGSTSNYYTGTPATMLSDYFRNKQQRDIESGMPALKPRSDSFGVVPRTIKSWFSR